MKKNYNKSEISELSQKKIKQSDIFKIMFREIKKIQSYQCKIVITLRSQNDSQSE